jgi:hypothetical protein
MGSRGNVEIHFAVLNSRWLEADFITGFPDY